MKVCKYKLEMVQKPMESFDVDAALLAHFLEFNTMTLFATTKFGDEDEQLNGIEADLGIYQADLEDRKGNGVDVVGHCKALAMTLWDWAEDIDNAACSCFS